MSTGKEDVDLEEHIPEIESRSLTVVQTKRIITPRRDSKLECRSAQVYLNYFSKVYEEKELDLWFKVYLPELKETEEFSKIKNLKSEIKKGIPVPLRGQVW